MAAKELEPGKLVKTFERLKRFKTFKTDVLEEAGRRAKEKFKKMIDDDPARRKAYAEKWAKESGGPNRVATVAETKELQYSSDQVKDASIHLDKVKQDFANRKDSMPAWLGANSLTNPVAMEFAARIAELPPDLRENPAVLMHESARMYWTVENQYKSGSGDQTVSGWLSRNLKDENHEELRQLLNRTIEEAQRLKDVKMTTLAGDVTFDDVMPSDDYRLKKRIDGRADIYRTAKRVQVDDIGSEPVVPTKTVIGRDGKPRKTGDKDHPEYESKLKEWEEWAPKRDKQRQQENLRTFLYERQEELDNIHSVNRPRRQRQVLENVYRSLENPKAEPLKREKDMRVFETEQTRPYIEQVKRELNRAEDVEEVFNIEKRKQQGEVKGRESVTLRWGDVRRKMGLEAVPGRSDDEMMTFQLSAADMNVLLRPTTSEDDVPGWMEWYLKFSGRIYQSARQTGKPGLPDEYKIDAVQELFDWVYPGDERYRQIGIQYLWQEEGRRNGLISALMYSGQGTEEEIKKLAFLSPADFQHEVVTYKYSNLANVAYEQAEFAVGARMRHQFDQSLQFLEQKSARTISGVTETLRNDDYYYKLLELDKKGLLTTEQIVDLRAIEKHIHTVGKGVIIEDRHMNFNQEAFNDLSRLQQQYSDLEFKRNSTGSLTPAENAKLAELDVEIKDAWRKYTLNPNEYRGADHVGDVAALAGMSPVEIEAYERLKSMLLVEGKANVPDWQLRAAVFSARRMMIGSGRAMTIAAKMVRLPAIEYVDPNGRYTMPAGFCEQLQRLENMELFMYRFSMGGKYGEVPRALLDIITYKKMGFKIDKKGHPVHRRGGGKHDHESKEVQTARAYTEVAQFVMGLPFSEFIRKNLLGTGFLFDGTNWRMDIAILDKLKQQDAEYIAAHGLTAETALENVALGVQLAMAGDGVDKIDKRKSILTKMAKRTPSKFFQLLGKDVDFIRNSNGLGIDTVEGQMFDRALAAAEMRTWSDQSLRYKDISLGDRADFDLVFGKVFDELHIDPAMKDKYLDTIQRVQQHVSSTRVETGTSILHEWARVGLPMNVSLADFDWNSVNFNDLNIYSLPRRMFNDQMPRYKAMGMVIEFLTKPEYMSPHDPAKTTFAKLKEIRDTVNAWQTADGAEKVVETLANIYFSMNTNRAINADNPLLRAITWMPGGIRAMKALSEVDLSKNSIASKAIRGFGKIPILKDIPEGDIEHLPHTIAQSVSYSVGAIGESGQALDEMGIEAQIREMQEMGVFTDANAEKILNGLRKEFKAGMLNRFWSVPRKYWWVVVVASIALAAAEAKKDDSHGGH